MEGWGYKKRLTGLTHPWQRRYFRLAEGETDLFYFKSPSNADGTERGSIDLLTVTRVCPTDDSVKSQKDPAVRKYGEHSLDVHTSEPRVYHLIFESSLDKEAWARAVYRAVDPALCKVHPTLQGVCGVGKGGGVGGSGAATSPSARATPAGSPAAKPPSKPQLQSPNNPFNLDRGTEGSGGGGGGGGGGGSGGGGSASALAEEAVDGGGGGGFLNLFSRKEKEAAPEAMEMQTLTGSREGSPAQPSSGGGRGRGGAQGGGPGRGRGRGRGGAAPPRGRGGGRGGGAAAQRGRGRGGGVGGGGALAGSKSQPLLDSEDEDSSGSGSGSDYETDSEEEERGGKGGCCAVA
jgi:hypothetical protein